MRELISVYTEPFSKAIGVTAELPAAIDLLIKIMDVADKFSIIGLNEREQEERNEAADRGPLDQPNERHQDDDFAPGEEELAD